MTKVSSVYIHVPVCRRKCHYCDFFSLLLPQATGFLTRFPGLIAQELALWREEADLAALETLYFGGGTPSLLPLPALRQIIELLPPARELTLEANPEGLDAAMLQGWRLSGINRLSLGVQSFDDSLLRLMGRAHSAAEAESAVFLAREAGFENISIDLIYGLPEQDINRWQRDIEHALALDTPHISLYGLSIHEDTPWGRDLAAGQIIPADEDLSADMLELAIDILSAAGYQHYEIANFARAGYESRHNTCYWRRENYLGLGPAAASCLLNRRYSNVCDVADYEAALMAGRLPLAAAEALDMEQVLAEAVFLGLRLAEGVDFAAFEQRYGVRAEKRYRRQIAKLREWGLICVDEQGMRLTRRGMLLGNEAFTEFV